MRRAGLLALVALTMPTVLAAAAEGDLALQSLAFHAPAAGGLDLHAAYANDTTRVARFELTAETLEVRVWRGHEVEARLLPDEYLKYRTSTESSSWMLTDVRVTLAAAGPGWLGVRWAPDAEATLPRGSVVAFHDESVVGFGGTPGMDAESPDQPFFRETFRAPHLHVDGVEALALEGDGVLRLSGLDLDVLARENASRLATGTTRDEGPAGRATVAWATLTFTRGTLRVEGLADAQAQALGATLAWTGGATLQGAEGVLQDADRVWRPATPAETLEGTFQGTLLPADGRIHAALAGDVTGGTLVAMARAPAPAGGAALALPWLILGVGLLVGSGATYAVLRRRARLGRPGVEDLLDLALQSAEAGDTERALAWIRRARAAAPASERLALEEAAILEAGGEDEAALRAYRAVAEAGNGEACWLLARGLARRGAHADDVAPWIRRALEREPVLAYEIEEDEALAPHLRRADVRDALDAARGKLG